VTHEQGYFAIDAAEPFVARAQRPVAMDERPAVELPAEITRQGLLAQAQEQLEALLVCVGGAVAIGPLRDLDSIGREVGAGPVLVMNVELVFVADLRLQRTQQVATLVGQRLRTVPEDDAVAFDGLEVSAAFGLPREHDIGRVEER
jgi:hypothetical protein